MASFITMTGVIIPGTLFGKGKSASMIKAGPEKEAAKIEKKSGVKTIAAVDGMRINFGRNLSDVKISRFPQ